MKNVVIRISKRFGAFVLGLVILVTAEVAAVSAQDEFHSASLDQGWDKGNWEDWYSATQGSRLIPKIWFLHLEQPGQPPIKGEAGVTNLFLNPKYIASFGYLPRSDNPLPVGFVEDKGPDGALNRTRLRWKHNQGEDEYWIGLNCSACHTSEIELKDVANHKESWFRIDGGPSLADFQGFINAFNRALVETRDDERKWGRFVSGVLGPQPVAQDLQEEWSQDAALLKTAFKQLVDWQLKEAAANRLDWHDPTGADDQEKIEPKYGPGRVDAFGHIFNKVALLLDEKAAGNRSDAPVSYPFIWRAPYLDKVQYNGLAPNNKFLANVDVGALGRNVGEVIGVFGDVKVSTNPNLVSGFDSSVKIANLDRLEQLLRKLRPPAWPAAIFKIEPEGTPESRSIKRGKQLYSERCVQCHEVVSRTDTKTIITTVMAPFVPTKAGDVAPLTDPWMACNAADYRASSGLLANYKSDVLTDGKQIPQTFGLAQLLTTTVGLTIGGQKLALFSEGTYKAALKLIGLQPRPKVEAAPEGLQVPTNPARTDEKQEQLVRCYARGKAGDQFMGYTSRPLAGIWATAPYLHNGSVPTILDLLKPPSERPKHFYLGTREYDAVLLGFRQIENPDLVKEMELNKNIGNYFLYRTRDKDGNIIDGNSNEGHNYSNETLSDDDRHAIIAYLKTL